MWIAVNGLGFNTITGQFTVLQAIYDSTGKIQNFAAEYIQFGDGSTEAWTGHVYYQYDYALSSVPEPATFGEAGLGGLLLVSGLWLRRVRGLVPQRETQMAPPNR